MAYTKNTWACGDEITADKLNHIEEGIENAGGGCDCGFECVESRQTLTDESVTTSGAPYVSGTLSYNQYIDVDTLVVTFDGTEYTCEKITNPGNTTISYGGLGPGGPVFSEYPFLIMSTTDNGNAIYSESAGTYSIKLETNVSSTQVTECFGKAVKKALESFALKYVKDGENNAVLENDVGGNTASGMYSRAGGKSTTASGNYSYTEGFETSASGEFAHAEGCNTTASRSASHAEGDHTTASGTMSHAEGEHTTASGYASHAENYTTLASGYASHAEGSYTTASGGNSHAQNTNTIAQGQSQTVIGEYNIAQGTRDSHSDADYALIVGNGNSATRRNAFAMKWDGTFVFANGTEITPAQFASLLALLS